MPKYSDSRTAKRAVQVFPIEFASGCGNFGGKKTMQWWKLKVGINMKMTVTVASHKLRLNCDPARRGEDISDCKCKQM